MPDADDPRGGGPAAWRDAFAALPQETPPADAWRRVAAQLDARAAAESAPRAMPSAGPTALPPAPAGAGARRHHGRRRALRAGGWLGAAAVAAFALVVAWPRHDIAPATGHAVAPPRMASVAPGETSASPPPAETPAPKPVLVASGRKAGSDAGAIALPKAVEAARKPRYATRRAPVRAATPGAAQPLDALYAESARLEALLALARDDRVASAGAALLSAELDAQVASIDMRLAQPGLDDAQRTALWQARVDALRQAAGFESTQRVLASQGDGGALLVSVD